MKRLLPHVPVPVVLAALVAFGPLLACDDVQDRIISRAVESRTRDFDRSEWLEDGAMHVVLCGTGSPLADPNRAGPCTAVVAGGALFIVDTGPGSTERLLTDRMPLGALRGVFLTHFHSDHIGELGELGMQSWAVGGRSEPLDVFGPVGVSRVVDGFVAAYALDTEYRVAHHGADVMNPRGAEMIAVSFAPDADGSPTQVLEHNGVTVTAVLVDHAPIAPAVAYRFDWGGRSLVISGDTIPTANLVRLAQGADLLVHEVLAESVVKIISATAGANDRPRIEKLTADVLDYHTSPGDAVELAKQAEVDTVVFSHMVPPVPGPLVGTIFLRGVEDGGQVEVVLGEDGMHFRLPRNSDAIELESL